MDSSPKEWDPSPIHAGQMRENSDVLSKGEPLGERREPKLKLLRRRVDLRRCAFSLCTLACVSQQRANCRVNHS